MLADTRSDLGSHLSGLAGLIMAQPVRVPRLRPETAICNELLTTLPEHALARLRPLLQPLELRHKQILQDRNAPLLYGYFIESGAASLLCRSGEHGCVEIGTLGRSGFVGIPLVLGTVRSPHRCVVQVPGKALRIGADDLRMAIEQIPCFRNLLLAYVQTVMTECTQLAACNSHHTLKQRLARWLLVARDRLDSDEIPLTHQSLSRSIAVRRAGVTVAVGHMETAGIVRLGRGRLTILDRSALERTSCDCYRAIRAEHRRLLCSAEREPPRFQGT